MSLSAGITQYIASIVKLNWLLNLAAVLLVCCSCINSKPFSVDQLADHQMIDNYYPSILLADDYFVERAAPRLGRASPRLGRHAVPLLHSRLNHAGRYYNADDDAINDYQYDIDSSMQEKRATPRFGRSIELDEKEKNA